MKSPVLAATPLLMAVAWTIALIVESSGYNRASVLMIGLGMMIMGVVAVVGIVVVGGRWARRLGFGVIGASLLIALIRPIDIAWFVALASTALASAALFAPSVTSRVRKLPAAAGPPARSVIVPLILISTPFLIGIGAPEASWPALTVGLSAPVVAFGYARVIPGGLLAIRVFWPALAIGMALPMGWPAGAVSATLGLVVSALSWDASVKTAFHPPREVGSTYPIPPELAPQEILDAARIDERGRPT